VIGECRQDGDHVVVDAVLPQGVRLFYVGMIGLTVGLTSMVLSFGGPLRWWFAIPLRLVFLVNAQYVVHVRRARAAGRLLPRYLEAACAEAAAGRST